MGHTSKDLLHLEHKNSSSSSIESALLVCHKKDSLSQSSEPLTDRKPEISSAPKSQVIGKVKDFLGLMEQANERLKLAAKDNSEAYDIEALTGNESEVIELDLMLGIADLHTPEAVAAAESAIAGYQPLIPLAASSSETESEDSSDEDNDDDEEDNDENNDKKTCSSMKDKISTAEKEDCSSEAAGKSRSRKRPKIVELS